MAGGQPGYFNPRATYVARPEIGRDDNLVFNISIHAPLTWRDGLRLLFGLPGGGFQSTRHLRGATLLYREADQRRQISIHAPLTWRDWTPAAISASLANFNPRATYVARQQLVTKIR